MRDEERLATPDLRHSGQVEAEAPIGIDPERVERARLFGVDPVQYDSARIRGLIDQEQAPLEPVRARGSRILPVAIGRDE
ncbi:MAG: hypothetical protein EA351_02090 [Gemmatimonadales bacterium]|nr:MAG: hypothetical protein EA351_02090 [Gemmatimonadales bacterium]